PGRPRRADGPGRPRAAAGHADPTRTGSDAAGGTRNAEQADSGHLGRRREDDQGAPRTRDAKDASGVGGRSRPDGAEGRLGGAVGMIWPRGIGPKPHGAAWWPALG